MLAPLPAHKNRIASPIERCDSIFSNQSKQTAPLSGAVCGIMGRTNAAHSSRFRIASRLNFDATKRVSKCQRAPPAAAAGVSGHRPPRQQVSAGTAHPIQSTQAATMAARRPINWEQSPAPNQRNRVASRPDFVATKRGSECPRIPPAPNKACKPPPRRRSARQIGNKVLLRIKLDFESLPDSKSLRLSAAAIISGHRPPLPDSISP